MTKGGGRVAILALLSAAALAAAFAVASALGLVFTAQAAEGLTPSFGSATISSQSWTQNQQITAFTLPTATGGDGSLTYALSPSLPAGVTKNASHEVSGTPTGHQAETTYTWKATDTDGDAAELTFTIAIAEDLSPSFGSASIANQTWTQNSGITAFTLPTATGGDGSLTYALSPSLPAGMTKSASHQVSGTPTGHQAETTYTWKATDTDGDAVELTFTIAIAEDLSPSFGSESIANQSWTQNSGITAFTLPTATGGDGSLTHTLSPSLPAGVSKNASHEVSGTPTGHQAETSYTWKATDADGDAVELTFTIAIAEDLSPSFGSESIANQTWTQNSGITAFNLATATGGNGLLTYTLSPALPAGVTKNASHQVSGTPTGHQTATTYTWKATDTDGDAAELTFTIAIAEDLSPSFGSESIANQTWTQNQQITALTLPTATGGDGSLTYALSPALPSGVSKNASHEVSGTPTGHQTATTYTWKATDADGDTAELTFTIAIEEDLEPSFGRNVSGKTWFKGRSVNSFTLPTATGGNGALSYALSPSLPAGVSKDASHEISGTPSVRQTVTTYTWTATDADGDEAELTFTIVIFQGTYPNFSGWVPDKQWTQNKAITAFTLPTGTGGDGSLTYSISPALPAGVTKNASHQVSGTPTGHQASTEYTWIVADEDGDEARLTFEILIYRDQITSFGSRTVSNQEWTLNQSIGSLRLPQTTDGDHPISYDLSPALPTGVTLNASNRTVTGTPTAYQEETTYTWKATDADGDEAELTFKIKIDQAPSFGSASIPNQFWNQNEAITAFNLATATGGDGALTYTLSPALPTGVSKDDDHEVSGTPTVYQASTRYTWKVADADGDTDQLTFVVSMTQDYITSFGSGTIDDQSWTQNEYIDSFLLPRATTGDTPITHTLSPALPAGVTKNHLNLVSGKPTGYQAETTYTWKAEDADGDTAELTFTITIAEDPMPSFGSKTIPDQSWTHSVQITPFNLATATGGNSPLTYTLSPALPSGISKNASHQVSGTPATIKATTTYTWKATDADGDTAQLTFTITVAADKFPNFGDKTIPGQQWTQRQPITPFNLATATGGDLPLTYTLTPATLPDGVSMDANNRISGTPTGYTTGRTRYYWKVSDADGDTAQLIMDIIITRDYIPSFGSTTIPDKEWTLDRDITGFTLPSVPLGDAPITYTLSPALPAGVRWNETTRYVSGRPTAYQEETTYTWKAKDADGDEAELTFKIKIDRLPSFGALTIADKYWTQNKEITAFNMATATGGDGALTYSISPALPAGVTRDTTTQAVSGTPTGHQRATEYTWKVTDADGDTATLTFDITITKDNITSFGSATIDDQEWTLNRRLSSFYLPAATIGDGNISYTLSPALPDGVTRRNDRLVSGTPTAYQSRTQYTWKATDADGDVAQLTFYVEIDRLPSFGALTIADKHWTQNKEITAFNMATATGGDGALTYSISPALPAGVTRDTTTQAVTGTPTGHQTATEYTWKVTDADGDTATLTFDITITKDNITSFGSATIDDQEWTLNRRLNSFLLPVATIGDAPITYTLSPALPAGVTKNASHQVSGTPTAYQARTRYTWKATDADGDEAQLIFYVGIDRLPSFGTATIPNQNWTQRQQITPFNLATATGGDGSLTYTLSPALPTGVGKDSSHRVRGEPTGHQTATTYTWKATDADGDYVTLTFTIAIDGVPSFGSAIIGDKSWTQRQAITAFTLPLATGGDGSLTYALSPALPAGVTKNASHRVSGTPSSKQVGTIYTWKATDADGDTAQLNFTIGVDGVPSFGSATIADQTWTQNKAITPFTLPTATGGDGSLTYTLSPTTPAGVGKDSRHRVRGEPTGHQTATTYTWKATDRDGDAVQLTFTITIAEDLVPSFGSASIANQTWTQNKAITAFNLATATGGDGSLTHIMFPPLPAGVTKNASHQVSGTPTGHLAETTYTWMATDGDGDTAQLTFTISVAEDLAPSFGSARIANKTWTQRQAITAFNLATATGGDGSLVHTLSPSLPAGVTKNASHEVSGTPTGHQTATTYTWKATDADGDVAQLTFTIAIAEDLAPSFGTTTIPNQSWTQNKVIDDFILPQATGGDGPLSHDLSPSLPAGVNDGGAVWVNGTPTVHQTETTYTWTATDTDGDTAQLTFTITIAEDLAPSFGSVTISNKIWTQRQAITAFTLPLATGGDRPRVHTLTPSLPAGVTLSADPWGQVSGTPSEKLATTTYTWIVSDADGDTDQLTFTIAVDGVPTFGSATISDKTWTQNQAITAFTLPTATGGDGSLTYAISPSLPAGMSKNASHQVSGTPTGHQTATTYTWTATDGDGDTAQLTFTITIAEDLAPSFSTTIGDKSWTQRQAITAFTLPTASGGDGSLTYALTPSLPAGVSKNASHRVSGTPTGHQTATTYTWKATDTDGDAAQLTFTITIAQDLAPSFGAATIANQTWTQNNAITAFNLATATGGDGSLTYALSPTLPAGVTKNASHQVSGTPTVHQTATTYTWTATDGDGDTAQLTFTITIVEDLAPSFGAATIGDKSWTQRQAITAFTLPTATGGDGSLTYALSPTLPAGVSKNASHQVSGTPTGHQTATTYTWKAEDGDGDTAQLTFTITIAEDLAPSFGAATIANQTWTQNKEITAFTLPQAAGGDGSLTYALSPSLPREYLRTPAIG